MCRADHIGSPIQAGSLNNAVCSECTLVDPIMRTDSILAESRIQTYSNNILYIRMLKKAIAAAKRKSDPSQKDAAPKKKPKNNEKNKNKVVKKKDEEEQDEEEQDEEDQDEDQDEEEEKGKVRQVR